MRLIDADALIKQFDAIATESQPVSEARPMKVSTPAESLRMSIAKEMIRWLNKMPTANPWISVKDRLPKSVANKALVWLEHEDLNGYIGYGHYEKFHGEEMWYDLEHGERFDKHGYIVTYWMPLPEPPEDISE